MSAIATFFSPELAQVPLSNLPAFSRWWAIVPLVFLFAYGFLRAIQERFEGLEEKITTGEERAALNDLLGDVHREGQSTYDLGGDEAYSEWATFTHNLLEDAFGRSQAALFLSNRGIEAAPPNDERAKYSYIQEMLMGNRLTRLQEIMNRTDLEMRPGFDPRSYTRQENQPSAGQIHPSVALARSQAENARLEAMHAERIESDRHREQLVAEFTELITQGDSLANGSYTTQDEVEDWEARASKLIEMALGTKKRRDFCRKDPDFTDWYPEKIPEDAAEDQVRALELLDRLKSRRMEVNRFVPPPLNLHPDFDIEEYRRWLIER